MLSLVLAAGAIAGCGNDEVTAPTGGATPNGRYVGETSQGMPISFSVNDGTVRDVSFGWRARCDDGQVHANSIALPGGPINYRVFSTGGPLETGGIAHVDGRFDGARASGTLSRRRGSAFRTNCRATGIDWSAVWSGDAPPAAPSDGPREQTAA